jgi:hypothetical protein
MLELLWLENEAEARSEQTRPTKLWERLSASANRASPFGVILRPAQGSEAACPFRSWSYRPPMMPGLDLEIAAGTELAEPMWCYLKNARIPSGLREVTKVGIVCPGVMEGSVTNAMALTGVIDLRAGADHLLELQIDGGLGGGSLDFRPALPLVFHV